MAPEELTELWISRVNDYRSSGERVAAWCERHQVTPHQLFYWQRKVKQSGQQVQPANKPQWVSLRLDEPAASVAPPIVVKVGCATVEVRTGFEPSLFAEVVRTLKSLC